MDIINQAAQTRTVHQAKTDVGFGVTEVPILPTLKRTFKTGQVIVETGQAIGGTGHCGRDRGQVLQDKVYQNDLLEIRKNFRDMMCEM